VNHINHNDDNRYSSHHYNDQSDSDHRADHYDVDKYTDYSYEHSDNYGESRIDGFKADGFSVDESWIDETRVDPFSGDSIDSHDYRSEEHRDPDIYDYTPDRTGILYAEDFNDARPSERNRFTESLGKAGIGLAVAVFTVGFAAITVLASKPQLTPEEIVQMDGYKGQISNQTLYFNLASMRGCSSIKDCDGVVKSTGASPTADLTTRATQSALTSTKSGDSKSIASSNAANYHEIPAVAKTADNAEQRSTIQGVETGVWKVRQQWSIVRETPASGGAIVTSLDADTRVIVVNEVGEWREIATNPSKPKAIGYIHESLLQSVLP